MKIICLSCGGENNAAARLRIYRYQKCFKNVEIDFTIRNYLMKDAYPEKFPQKMLQEIIAFDILVLERVYLTKSDYVEIRKNNVKIVYDLDDAIYYVPSIQWPPLLKSKPNFPEYFKQFFRLVFRGGRFYSSRKYLLHEVLKFADGVMVGNEFLKTYCEKYSKHVTVIPTPVDIIEDPNKIFSDKKPIVIGWIGHPDGIHYIEAIVEALRIITEKYGERIIFRICSKPGNYGLGKIRHDFVPWNIEHETEVISSFDIGIMPLTHDGWAEGKCAYKALLFMGAGIPVVLSPVGMNNDIVLEGRTGFFADSETEWVEKLSLLIENASLRNKIAAEAKLFVENNFSRKIVFNKILIFLNSMFVNK